LVRKNTFGEKYDVKTYDLCHVIFFSAGDHLGFSMNVFSSVLSVSFRYSPVISRLTVNDVLERVWDDSGDEEDFSGSEDGESDDDYISEN